MIDAPLRLFLSAGFALKAAWSSFRLNNQFGSAAALAYYGFFAMIPLLLLGLLVLGNYVVTSRDALAAVDGLTRQMFPEFSKMIVKEVRSLSRSAGSWGVLGLIAVFWAIMPLAGGVRSAFKRIFRVEKRSRFMRDLLFDVMAVLIILVLFVVLVASSVGYSILRARFFNDVPLAYDISYRMLPFLLSLAFLAIFYALFAPRLRLRSLAAGTLATAVIWGAMKWLFSLFLTVNPLYGLAFGSLKALFIAIAWVYVSFAVILYGAEFMAVLESKDAHLLKELFLPPSRHRRSRLFADHVSTYAPGEMVCQAGEKGNSMYYILEGEVEAIREGYSPKRMRPGEFFGEIAMLLGGERTATVTAATDVHIVEISRDNWRKINVLDPAVGTQLLRQMAVRLKGSGTTA